MEREKLFQLVEILWTVDLGTLVRAQLGRRARPVREHLEEGGRRRGLGC